MQSRQFLPFLGIVGMVPLFYFLYPRSDPPNDVGIFDDWTPTPPQLALAVGKSPGGTFDDDRHRHFARMFQQRYRDHEHAIGVKFITPTKIKAMFAPIIPRWDMARVAIQARREASDIFGTAYDVDIYETYITARMRKLGEVRAAAEGGESVRFDPRFKNERPEDSRTR